MMTKLLFIFSLSLAGLRLAHSEGNKGGLFVEPSLTYELGETDVNYPSPFSNSSGNSDGIGLGARVGFHISEVIFFGLDGRYALTKFKDSSVSYEENATSTNWGPVVGIQIPKFGLRVWGAYVLGGQLDPDSSSNLDVKFKKAQGIRVGTGFRISMVSLNLEYQQLNYRDTILQQVGPFSTNSDFGGVELENKSLIASLSFPIEL